MAASDVVKVTLVVCGHLDDLEIRYVIGGSLASSAHGIIRSTNDVDIVADIGLDQADPLAARLEGDFYVEPDTIKEAILQRGSFNLIHFQTLFKVDVFVPADDALAQSQIRRRIQLVFPGSDDVSLPILSPEDVILQKLRWFDLGGRASDRQWSDILGVIETQQVAHLDLDFLREMTSQAGLRDLLDKALDEAE